MMTSAYPAPLSRTGRNPEYPRPSGGFHPGRDLKQAPRISRHNHICFGAHDVLHFAIAQLGGGLGFEQVVNAGRSAADF